MVSSADSQSADPGSSPGSGTNQEEKKMEQLYKCFQHWGNSVWVYSDPHFGEADMKIHFNYPDDDQQMKNINAKVGKNGTIIFLGDIGDINYIKKVRGYKILVMGNHDVGHTIYEQVFDEVYAGPVFVGEKILLSHARIDFPNAFNFHGHDHAGWGSENNSMNCCANILNFQPFCLNKFIKNGGLSKIVNFNRSLTDNAIKRKG